MLLLQKLAITYDIYNKNYSFNNTEDQEPDNRTRNADHETPIDESDDDDLKIHECKKE